MSVLLFLGLLWRVLSGYSAHECDWRRPGLCGEGRPLEHRIALRWHHLPRRARSGIALAAVSVLYGLLVHRTVTLLALAILTFAAVTFGVWRGVHAARHWRHYRYHVRPLELSVTKMVGAAPSSIEIDRHRDEETGASVIDGVVIEWSPDTEIREQEKQYALEAVTTRLPIEAPDAKWDLRGRARIVTFTPSEPPPFPVFWEGRFAAAVERAAPNELVFGIGKHDAIVTATYSESPHLCIPGGSGGGKSNLAAVLLMIELMRGSLIVNLDPKWTSHLWLQGLPNVISAHAPADIHAALVWLGRELERRTRGAYYSAEGTGRIRSRPGNRIVVLCEELNYGMPGLKDYHAEQRAQDKSLPKKSPAISALQGLACAGRASDIHMWLIAQLLTVESTGVRDSAIRTNAGIKAMVRQDPPGWGMAIGKHVPMPQPSDIPGRIQVVTVQGVPRETQVPYLHLVAEEHEPPEAADPAVQWARALAVSKDVAKIPIGGEYGVPEQLLPPVVRQQHLSLNAGQDPATGTTVAGPVPVPPALTVREAVERSVFGDPAEGDLERLLAAARRRVQRAGIEEVGRRDDDGNAKEYRLDDLYAVAKGSQK